MPCLPLADYPMRPPLFPLLQAAAVVMLCLPARAAIVVVDAGGVTITLAAPAQRIVSLAPNLTELLFAAGAGERVVGSVDFSDYPAAARALPRVGGHSLDLEAIVALKPDLVMAWESGTAAAAVSRLRSMGLNVHLSEPRRIEDIPGELERIGRLAGTGATADAAAAGETAAGSTAAMASGAAMSDAPTTAATRRGDSERFMVVVAGGGLMRVVVGPSRMPWAWSNS